MAVRLSHLERDLGELLAREQATEDAGVAQAHGDTEAAQTPESTLA
jgi:hypothetical protein